MTFLSLVKLCKAKIFSLGFDAAVKSDRQTTALDYRGDVYTVLVRDRALRKLAHRNSRAQQASDAVLPYLR